MQELFQNVDRNKKEENGKKIDFQKEVVRIN